LKLKSNKREFFLIQFVQILIALFGGAGIIRKIEFNFPNKMRIIENNKVNFDKY
jgi:hypothetical protein